MADDPWADFRVKSSAGSDDPWSAFRVAEPKTIYSGSVLPFSRDENGNVHFDSNAGLVGSIKRALTLPGDVAQGKFNVQPEEAGKWSEIDQARQNISDQELVNRSSELAGIASPTSVATRAGVGLAGVTSNALKKEARVPTSDELIQAYKDVRKSPEVKSVNIPIQDVKNVAQASENQLLEKDFRPTNGSAPATFEQVNNLRPKPPPEPTPQQRLQAEMNWEKLPEQPQVESASMGDILAARRAFGEIAKQRRPFPDMSATPDAVASRSVMGNIDNLIEQHAPQMIDANGNYSAGLTARALDARFQKAQGGAASTNSGLNVGNKIKQQADQILNNPRALRGLRPEEVSMLQDLRDGNAGSGALRWFSNVLGGGGGLGAVVTGEVASHTVGPAGWSLPIIGGVLKHIDNQITVKAANKISEAIRARSPLGKAMESSAQKWNDAHGAFLSKPSAANYAAFSIASRNLANTLSGGAGTRIDPAPLLRAVQGSKPATAQDKQQ